MNVTYRIEFSENKVVGAAKAQSDITDCPCGVPHDWRWAAELEEAKGKVATLKRELSAAMQLVNDYQDLYRSARKQRDELIEILERQSWVDKAQDKGEKAGKKDAGK